MERSRCWRYPIRPVMPFMAIRRVRVVMESPELVEVCPRRRVDRHGPHKLAECAFPSLEGWCDGVKPGCARELVSPRVAAGERLPRAVSRFAAAVAGEIGRPGCARKQVRRGCGR